MTVEATQIDPAEAVAVRASGTIHPVWVRITHWINAVAMVMMIGSGWEIYNASPLFPFTFPTSITLGGWLAGALLWHFAAMWLLVVNGLVYVTLGLATGRFRRKLLPIRPREVVRDVARGVDGPARATTISRVYNAVQKLLYLGVILAGVVDRAVRPRDLEAGAVAGADGAVRRLRRRALSCTSSPWRRSSVPGRSCRHGVLVPKTLRAMIKGR